MGGLCVGVRFLGLGIISAPCSDEDEKKEATFNMPFGMVWCFFF